MTLNRTQAPEAKPITNFSLKGANHIQLDNGIPLCVVSGGSQPIANLQLVFNAGKWHEAQKGQSHFTGQMLGEGTKNFSNFQISQKFEHHGVFWGVSVHADWLEMNFYSLNKQLKNVLPLITELLTEANFPEGELERLKARAIQETRVNQEKSSYVASSYLKEQLFGKAHPYGYILKEEDIENIAVKALRNFYQNRLMHNGVSVFVAGEITESHIEDINQSIGKLPYDAESAKEVNYDIPKTRSTIKHESWDDALQASLRIGKSIFVRNHKEQIPFSVLNTVLGGYFGSRLMKNIREDKGLTYGIYSSVSFMKNTGSWFIGADIIKEKKDLALQEIYREIEQLQNEPVPAEELELVKNYMCGNFVKSINSPIPIINCHKAIKLHNLPEDYYDSYIQKVRAVSAETVQELAKRYLGKSMVEVVVG